MEITFENNKLEKLANDFSKCQKAMGQQRAKLFNRRLQDLRDADTLEDVRFLPGYYHELTGDRKGQWACSLDGPYRLIFGPVENPIPTDKNGKYVWCDIKGITIVDIVDYHGN